VAPHRLEALAHLLRQGLALEGEFGIRPLEAMVAVARTIEESVVDLAGFERTDSGLRFALHNPPLRGGAFSAVRVGVDGAPPSSDGLRIATGVVPVGIDARTISRDRPLHLRPGEAIRFEVDRPGPSRGPRTVRLELVSVAIPPLVWLEFTAVPHPPREPR
jgi:hypothetical protein